MKKKSTEHERAVATVKAKISPRVPCVNADEDGYCTGPCEGSLCFKCASYQPVKPTPVVPEVVQPSALAVREVALEAPASSTPAECISFDLGMAKRCATASIYYLVRAGWRLAFERQGMAHGAWAAFCQESVGISDETARRYIKFFQETVGKFRTNHGLPAMVTELTDKMIAAATEDIESKTATGAMIELGVVKPPPNWGGDRREKAAENGHVVGRPKKDTNAPLAESDVDGELCAEEGRDLLSKLAGWALGADDGFGTLPDRELAKAVDTLGQMLKRAREIRDAREAGR